MVVADPTLDSIRILGDLGRRLLSDAMSLECEYWKHPAHVNACVRRVSRPYHTTRKDLDASHQPCGCRSHGQ